MGGSWTHGPPQTVLWGVYVWSLAATVIVLALLSAAAERTINSQMHLSLSMITADSEHLLNLPDQCEVQPLGRLPRAAT
jgi:hypothetical protein